MNGFLFSSPSAMHVFSCSGSQFFGAVRECLFQKKKVQQDDVIKWTPSSLTQRERSAKNAENIWWFCLRQLQSNHHFISFQWTFVVTFCQVWFDCAFSHAPSIDKPSVRLCHIKKVLWLILWFYKCWWSEERFLIQNVFWSKKLWRAVGGHTHNLPEHLWRCSIHVACLFLDQIYWWAKWSL